MLVCVPGTILGAEMSDLQQEAPDSLSCLTGKR